MTLQEKKATLIHYLNMKVVQGDWHGVSDAANDLREIEVELRVLRGTPTYTEPAASTGPLVQMDTEIPHHVNEVLGLLKLNDEELVDKMFPDYTELEEGAHAN